MFAIKPINLRLVDLLLLQLIMIPHFIRTSPLNHNPTQPFLSLSDSQLKTTVKSARHLATVQSQNPLLIRRSNPSGFADAPNAFMAFARAADIPAPAEVAPENLLIPAQVLENEVVPSGNALRLRPGDELPVPEEVPSGHALGPPREGEQVASGDAFIIPPQNQRPVSQQELGLLRENQLPVLVQTPPLRQGQGQKSLPDQSRISPRRRSLEDSINF